MVAMEGGRCKSIILTSAQALLSLPWRVPGHCGTAVGHGQTACIGHEHHLGRGLVAKVVQGRGTPNGEGCRHGLQGSKPDAITSDTCSRSPGHRHWPSVSGGRRSVEPRTSVTSCMSPRSIATRSTSTCRRWPVAMLAPRIRSAATLALLHRLRPLRSRLANASRSMGARSFGVGRLEIDVSGEQCECLREAFGCATCFEPARFGSIRLQQGGQYRVVGNRCRKSSIVTRIGRGLCEFDIDRDRACPCIMQRLDAVGDQRPGPGPAADALQCAVIDVHVHDVAGHRREPLHVAAAGHGSGHRRVVECTGRIEHQDQQDDAAAGEKNTAIRAAVYGLVDAGELGLITDSEGEDAAAAVASLLRLSICWKYCWASAVEPNARLTASA